MFLKPSIPHSSNEIVTSSAALLCGVSRSTGSPELFEGRFPAGRAFRFYSSLRCGVTATTTECLTSLLVIPNASVTNTLYSHSELVSVSIHLIQTLKRVQSDAYNCRCVSSLANLLTI